MPAFVPALLCLVYSEMILTRVPGLIVEVGPKALIILNNSSFRSVPIMRADKVPIVSFAPTVTTRTRNGFKEAASCGVMRRKEARS